MTEENKNESTEEQDPNTMHLKLEGMDKIKITAKDKEGNTTELVNTKG